MSDRVAESGVQLGRGIRTLRKKRHWKQDVLAAEAGLNRATISLIESAKTNPSMFDVERIANALDTSISGLMAAGRGSLRLSDSNLKDAIAKRVVEARTKLGLSRSEFGKKSGFLPQYLSTTERGKRLVTLRNLLRLADFLEVNPVWLIGEEISNQGRLCDWEEVLDTLGKRLAEVRVAAGQSVYQLSNSAGLEPSHIARIEAGEVEPTLPTLLALCKGLGVKLNKILR